jgi:transcriptional regulator with XRE-family HTH domain
LSSVDAYLALKSERVRQGKTAATVAAYLGVTEDQVRRYDSGRSDIGLRQASRYAECLGKQLGDILPGSQVKSGEIQPFLMALQDFEPSERAEVVEHATRSLVFMSRLLIARPARHDNVITSSDAADRILHHLSSMTPEEQNFAAQVFDAGIEKFASAHLNGEARRA